MNEAFNVFVAFGIPILVMLLLTILGSRITKDALDKQRREQHPEYFRLFDEAIAITEEVHRVTEYKSDYFKFKYKLIYVGLRDGECTVEYFQEYLDRINKEYVEFAEWFNTKQLEANHLFKAADLYAKEHNLKWGILY